ncbi:MAG: dehydrogenase [Gammaproteobacteria bacterium]|nr:dehydrogenase [Gammaproteobacteria bacterium]|tara:strand:- start:960 stop:1982 length:1023 start_codon:yes stop_codon:yes gene_type:complete
MKSAILIESKKPLILADIELPKNLEFGQVQVKLFYSGICGAQINEIDALKGPDKFLPHLLGHEGSGIVEKIGEGVTTVKPGDHVVLHWRKSKGIQSNTPKYLWNDKIVNAGWVTTFNEKAIISENRLTVIPKEADLKTAALYGCAITSGFGAVNNDAKVQIGQSVLIFGLGGMGLSIAYASSLVSAYPIIGIDIHQEKLDLAKKFGVTHTFTSINEDNLKDILNNKGPDITFETTGISSLMEKAYEISPDDRKIIFVGVPTDKIKIYTLPLAFEKSLSVSSGGDCIPDLDIPRYIRMELNKKLDLKNFITHEFDLSQINDAIDLFRTGKAGRIILKLNKE